MKYGKEILKDICKLIESDDYTQKEICQQVGINQDTFTDWKHNHSDFKKSVNISIKKRLKIKPVTRKYGWADYSYIYIVKCGDFDYYKIGISKIKPHLRLSQLQTSSPFLLQIIHIFKTDNSEKIEFKIHNQYSKKLIRGEWFEFKNINKVISDIEKEIIKNTNSQYRLSLN